ncbi:glutamyl-tRNA reductase [Catenulispora sp. NF23]|uniref:Glutamyl-tRNA reductase n=1 Tax=Catenulispora pinistramenti TaxID=2705254 RepID=A0ABS5KPR6_9ACTN|nr:glutamyl-tRNA reductase [Catenulispora pinistramenti]MBS2535571.1 glutamyl-tRNA reductase [Catenulispora pinistramenti]MBS2548039.1 glutamyl-tRNA reductase [Catenulispora pinistramenti]
MSLLAVGLSHRSAPHALLERAALSTERTGKLLADLAASQNVHEAAALATCNRIEVYAGVDKFHAAVTEITELLSVHTGVEPAELTQHLYVHYDGRAVQHLFTVACGLDSMVVGEPQILGQIRTALAAAQEHGTAGRALNDAMQQALRVGKRAHSETGLDRAGQSVVSVALDAAYQALGVEGPNDLRVLIIGAGSMAALAAASLNRAGVRHMVVANRTQERAEHLATQYSGAAVPISEIVPALGEADLVVACTGAPGYVITGEMLNRAAHSHPIALVDLALPRDVDPAVRELAGVHVVDLERVAEDGSAQAAGAAQEIAAVRDLVLGEVEAYAAAQRAEAVAPTVAALRVMAADVVRAELDRLRGKTPGLSDKDRAEVEQTVRRVVDKLLHVPTVRVKQLAGAPGGSSYAEALRELFGLDPASVEAVSAANAAGTTNEVSA